jgi:hypothetical protein
MRTTPTWRDHLPLVPVAVLGTAFGAVSGTGVDASAAMAVFGLVWGVIAMLVAPRLARAGASSMTRADVSVTVTLLVALVALGGTIHAQMQSATPQLFVASMQATSAHLFFPVLHSLFEWLLLPVMIMLNWTYRRRNLLLVTAGVFYLFRIASAVYFAPMAMGWGQLPIGTPITGDLYDDVETWLRLNWLRVGFQDVLTPALLVVARYHPRYGRSSHSIGGRAR